MAVSEHHDVLIVGAGLSGINTAHVLRETLPHRTFAILEARPILGGTWSFFRYPGFRSDSYMTSFGLRWHPWPHRHKMASAAEIVDYLEDAVDTDNLRDKIRFEHKVLEYEWRTEDQLWTLEVEVKGVKKIFTANFVISCAGYYSYERALQTKIPGIENFGGQVIHPQWWPEDVDVSGKKIIVIGSGATAITIVPALAKAAAMVTQLQRSPSFVVSRFTTSRLDDFLRRWLPLAWVHWLVWWKDVALEVFATQWLLAFPGLGRTAINSFTKKALRGKFDADVHFNPSYNPFEQRLCLCPNGDFFKALRQDNCDIVTDVIETVTEDGILLKSGKTLTADIIVTATGLYVELFGGLTPKVDGQAIPPGSRYAWRGCMLDSLPNIAFIMGYVTTSWTPGADIMARIVMRVMKRMETTGATSVMPVIEHDASDKPPKLAVAATSNYFLRAADRIPKVTNKGVWYGRTNLVVDVWAWLFGSVTKGLLYSGGDGKKDE